LRVRFTHPRALNDLLELRPSFGQLVTPSEAVGHLLENPLDLATIARKAHEELPPELRSTLSPEDMERFTAEKIASPEGHMAVAVLATAALGMMNSFTPRMRQLIYDRLDSLVGVFSLAEAWDNGPMWAHYSANNTGFLIGFDPAHPFFNRRRSDVNDFYHLRKVVYSAAPDEPRTFRDLSNAASIFLTKELRWSYEQEWRMVVTLADAAEIVGSPSDPIHLFDIPPHAVSSIVLGVRSTPELQEAVKAHLVPNAPLAHVRLFRASVDDARGGLALEPAD
jgi:hypothetical protein